MLEFICEVYSLFFNPENLENNYLLLHYMLGLIELKKVFLTYCFPTQ